MAVGIIEGGKGVAIDVEHGAHGAIGDEGYHNLGARLSTAGDMSGKLLHVGDDLCGGFGPGGATDTTSLADAVASDIALKGAEDKLLVTHKVEPYPKPSESLGTRMVLSF